MTGPSTHEAMESAWAPMALPGVDTLPPEALRQKALSQWFTPADVAMRLARWCEGISATRVLEPSAGDGALVRAIRQVRHVSEIDAVELDPRFTNALSIDPLVRVECCDYLTRRAPPSRYNLAFMNPPYEDGLDSRFVAKAMDESERVIALVRLAMLETQRTHDRVWSRVADGSWTLSGLAIFVRRPIFVAPDSDGGKTAFAAIKLRRSAEDLPRKQTVVEWWT